MVGRGQGQAQRTGPRVCPRAESSARTARASPLLSLSSSTVFPRPWPQPQGCGRGGRKWLVRAQAGGGGAGPVQTRPSGQHPHHLGGSDPTSPCGLWQAEVG